MVLGDARISLERELVESGLRSGTLRAPAVRAGKTWLIGFHEGAWTDVLR